MVHDDTLQCSHDAPDERDGRKPYLRPNALQHDVPDDFETDIADEEHSETGQVLVAGEVQVGGQAVEFGVGDVGAVEEREQV